MTPNVTTAHHFADHLSCMPPEKAGPLLDQVAQQLEHFALTHGLCSDCAAQFALDFLRLVNERLRELTRQQRVVH